ncbi:unnamed protein product [Closterium sp. NIES-53]
MLRGCCCASPDWNPAASTPAFAAPRPRTLLPPPHAPAVPPLVGTAATGDGTSDAPAAAVALSSAPDAAILGIATALSTAPATAAAPSAAAVAAPCLAPARAFTTVPASAARSPVLLLTTASTSALVATQPANTTSAGSRPTTRSEERAARRRFGSESLRSVRQQRELPSPLPWLPQRVWLPHWIRAISSVAPACPVCAAAGPRVATVPGGARAGGDQCSPASTTNRLNSLPSSRPSSPSLPQRLPSSPPVPPNSPPSTTTPSSITLSASSPLLASPTLNPRDARCRHTIRRVLAWGSTTSALLPSALLLDLSQPATAASTSFAPSLTPSPPSSTPSPHLSLSLPLTETTSSLLPSPLVVSPGSPRPSSVPPFLHSIPPTIKAHPSPPTLRPLLLQRV